MKNKSAHTQSTISTLLIKCNVSMCNIANKIPKEHKVFVDFLRSNAKVSTILKLNEVYHWAFDVDIFICSIVTSKLITNKSRLNMTTEDKELIKNINALKRGLKYDLNKLKRVSITFSDFPQTKAIKNVTKSS